MPKAQEQTPLKEVTKRELSRHNKRLKIINVQLSIALSCKLLNFYPFNLFMSRKICDSLLPIVIP